jgi:two-component system phosphate regulon sensor histidine kinase PhoR
MNNELLDEKLLANLPENIVQHIEVLERIRKDFVANVSHELRTPLTVVIGYLQALLDQTEQEETTTITIYQKMLQQTLRMQTIIEDLLTLSRIETNQSIPVSRLPVDINAILATIMQSAERLAAEKQQTLTCEIDHSLTISGNQGEIHSLFSNVIFNAIKYTPNNGNIAISWYADGNKAIFAVKDTGIGVAKKYIPRLTERFYRVDKGRSRESGGTGLGLAICKHVLIRHGGLLEIDSEEGKGSLFRCIFPEKIAS